MNISGQSLWWVLSVAAGSAVAYIATSKNSKKAKKSLSKGGVGERYSLKHSRNMYDDSEVYYI